MLENNVKSLENNVKSLENNFKSLEINSCTRMHAKLNFVRSSPRGSNFEYLKHHTKALESTRNSHIISTQNEAEPVGGNRRKRSYHMGLDESVNSLRRKVVEVVLLVEVVFTIPPLTTTAQLEEVSL